MVSNSTELHTAHVIPGLLLLPISFCSDQPYVCIALMSASFGFNGAVSTVTLCNYHDLSPNYATTLNSIINGLGNSAGFLSPLVVAYFTADNVSCVIRNIHLHFRVPLTIPCLSLTTRRTPLPNGAPSSTSVQPSTLCRPYSSRSPAADAFNPGTNPSGNLNPTPVQRHKRKPQQHHTRQHHHHQQHRRQRDHRWRTILITILNNNNGT